MLTKTQYMVLTEDNFQANVLAAQTPVLVDCWASWCSSFQQINPVLEELAIAFAGHIQIGRLNVAIAEPLAERYGIRAIPTLLLFKDGQVLKRVIGHSAKQDLLNSLSLLLPGRPVSRSRIACL